MSKFPAIIVDIDGTVALRGTRDPHDLDHVLDDKPNWGVIEAVSCMQFAGYHTVFVSGRQEKCRPDTTLWLQRNNLIEDHLNPENGWYRWSLFMRANGDGRSDELVKDQIFQEQIEPFYRVAIVFDDRDRVVRMWREKHKLAVFQVAYGDF